MNLPRPIRKLIESFEKLPGIGPKTAQRLTFYLLHVPQNQLDEFAESLERLKKDTVLCSICFSVAENDPCPICSDQNRDKSTICVVGQPLDILAIEKTDRYRGVYHVLHGVIDPLNNIGPEEIKIDELIQRIQNSTPGGGQTRFGIQELILATNPNMEGEATAMYIANRVRDLQTRNSELQTLKLSRIGLGLPTGGDLEYADENTLQQALAGRRDYQ